MKDNRVICAIYKLLDPHQHIGHHMWFKFKTELHLRILSRRVYLKNLSLYSEEHCFILGRSNGWRISPTSF
ncbi:hypothetical protein L1887_05043 [Cichorium endivia]|nr:hypothetical protein L1887_05043 [Cichorium endivia]